MKGRNQGQDAEPKAVPDLEGGRRDRAWLCEGLILLAFILLAAAGVVTVLVPGVGEQPDGDSAPGKQAASGEHGRSGTTVSAK